MKSIQLIDENYDQIFIGQYNVGKKHVLGSIKPKRCRCCKKPASELTFSTEAHAIPELLGNRQLVSTDECDECNKHFALHVEDHLGKFTKPYRVMGQVRGKKKVPSYKSIKGLSRVDLKPSIGFEIQQYDGDPFVEIDKENKQLIFHFIIEKHCPSAVYKALVKSAISIMPEEELENFEHARRWIMCSDHTKTLFKPLMLLMYFVPGPKPHRETSIMLLRKKMQSTESRLPYCIFVIAFGNLQLQIMVPAISDNRQNDEQVQMNFPRFPSAFGADWPYGEPKATTIDLSSGEYIEPREFTLSMHYGELAETDG
jgi:hypothetical protein